MIKYVTYEGGSDTTGDGSSTKPWATIEYALKQIPYYTGDCGITLMVDADVVTAESVTVTLPTTISNRSLTIKLSTKIGLIIKNRIQVFHGTLTFTTQTTEGCPGISFENISAADNSIVTAGHNGTVAFNTIGVTFYKCKSNSSLFRAIDNGYIYLSGNAAVNCEGCTGRLMYATSSGYIVSATDILNGTGVTPPSGAGLVQAANLGSIYIWGVSGSVGSDRYGLSATNGGIVVVASSDDTHYSVTVGKTSTIASTRTSAGGRIYSGAQNTVWKY